MSNLDDAIISELIRLKADGCLYHRENKNLEFKEQYNHAGLAEYLKDFAAFANSDGGYIIFGISNTPRKLVGLSDKAYEQFEGIDEERITGYLLDIFSPSIDWAKTVLEKHSKKFGVFYIPEAKQKPIITKKDEGRDQLIKSGDVYYRYAGYLKEDPGIIVDGDLLYLEGIENPRIIMEELSRRGLKQHSPYSLSELKLAQEQDKGSCLNNQQII